MKKTLILLAIVIGAARAEAATIDTITVDFNNFVDCGSGGGGYWASFGCYVRGIPLDGQQLSLDLLFDLGGTSPSQHILIGFFIRTTAANIPPASLGPGSGYYFDANRQPLGPVIFGYAAAGERLFFGARLPDNPQAIRGLHAELELPDLPGEAIRSAKMYMRIVGIPEPLSVASIVVGMAGLGFISVRNRSRSKAAATPARSTSESQANRNG